MRIIYRDIRGRRREKQFNDWREMCVWLKRCYPFLKAAQEIGEIVRA